MLRLAVILAMSATAAVAQTASGDSYVIYSSLAACQARSQAQCQTLGCDGVNTKRWWACVGPLSSGAVGPRVVLNGSYALDIQASGPFGPTTNNVVQTNEAGLTAGEQSNAVLGNTVAPLAANATAQ